MGLTREQVVDALRTVQDPELFKDIVTLGMLKEVAVSEDRVDVRIELTTPACPMKARIRQDVEEALRRAGACKVHVEFTAPERSVAGGGNPLPQVQHVIAVGAGKGGVGKSTIAVNLAVALARQGMAAGLMDGDVYGPSTPTMLGIRDAVPRMCEGRLIPHFVHGIHAVTIGSLVEPDKPLIWRGPMAHGAFKQLLIDSTDWPRLDYLIVDLPPGTGDVPLTLCQLLPLAGAVIVATPQQVALDDCIRAANMFQQLGVPVLGIVENMSYFVDPGTGAQHDLFGRGGAEQAAQQLGLPFLGAVPLFPTLRLNSDRGNPTANFDGEPALRESLETVARNLLAQVNLRACQPRLPELNIT